jgi:hypothetical protein
MIIYVIRFFTYLVLISGPLTTTIAAYEKQKCKDNKECDTGANIGIMIGVILILFALMGHMIGLL